MSEHRTEQENFWAGEFGKKYINRNRGDRAIAANTVLFAEIFQSLPEKISTVMEFGANIGNNLVAINRLLPFSELTALEINAEAVEVLRKSEEVNKVYHTSIMDFEPEHPSDLIFTKGVLIHINPDHLENVYNKMYSASKRYICIIEYYNPTPVTIEYRGHSERLFKRDFAGDLMDMYPDLRLINYGFVYHRDNNFHLDDLNWFLMEKS